MADLGPERPGQASETRQLTEGDRLGAAPRIGNRLFFALLAVIVLGIVAFFALR